MVMIRQYSVVMQPNSVVENIMVKLQFYKIIDLDASLPTSYVVLSWLIWGFMYQQTQQNVFKNILGEKQFCILPVSSTFNSSQREKEVVLKGDNDIKGTQMRPASLTTLNNNNIPFVPSTAIRCDHSLQIFLIMTFQR